MDYNVFYAEIADWINQANKMAMKHGITSEQFWDWVSDSVAYMCNKYDNNQLVIKQMKMLASWLDDVYENKN